MSIPDSRGGSATSPIYNFKDIFMLIREYDGDPISLNSFSNACNTAYSICSGDQHIFLIIRIKNQLRGRAAQLINSRDLNQWEEISNLLNIHFGDPRDINSLILDLQKLKQLPQENPITFCNRVINLNSKMQSSITKQNLSRDQKLAQSDLIENMTLNTLLTGLEPKIGQIIRASSPNSIVDAVQRIKREMQLSYFEDQRSNIRRNRVILLVNVELKCGTIHIDKILVISNLQPPTKILLTLGKAKILIDSTLTIRIPLIATLKLTKGTQVSFRNHLTKVHPFRGLIIYHMTYHNPQRPTSPTLRTKIFAQRPRNHWNPV
ncbi:hypothetical protein ABEB36_009250 [Hypothenemus hampei]|uniref:Uncharacterized protein n=1 Tax=Hypothenemus hampei TaxID=57062 RepID=A0ABD1EGA7_HYPHA